MSEQRPLLVYRDRIGAVSEIGFLRRQYVGFTRLRPVWVGRTLLPQAGDIGEVLRLGGDHFAGPLQRLLFRHLGVLPQAERDRLLSVGVRLDTATPADAAAGMPFGGAAQLAPGGAVQLTPGGEAKLAPVLHAQFARGGALALPLAQALGLRLVVTLHGGDVSKHKNWQRTVLSRRWPALVRQAAWFVCVSNAVAEMAAARGAPAEKLAVLPIGVDVPEEPPPSARPPRAHLFVGRFVEKKGVHVLADAIRQLRAAGDRTPVTCVGDGKLHAVLADLAASIEAVELTGWLPPQAVRERMAEAVTLLVPSVVAADGDAEGLPSVIPEAMAQACPVIGSDHGGITEAIRHGQTGLLVPPGDASALAAAMHRLAGDPAHRRRLGLAGFAYARAELNAHIQSAKLEDLLLAS